MARIKYYDPESGDWKCADQANSSGSSQNADLSQNDPTQPDYIKNRTHWVEGEQTAIEWDGNTEGRGVWYADGSGYCKVSDTTIPQEEVFGGSVTRSDGTTMDGISIEAIMVGTNCYGIGNMILVAYATNVTFMDVEMVLPDTGVYFMYTDSIGYISKLTYGSVAVHQLDEKFIPDSIARTASTLPMPATATVGQFIMVSSIDENGVVTATEAVDAPTLPNAEEVAF